MEEEYWYQYLNQKGKHNLIDNEIIDYDVNVIICRQGLNGRKFRKFENRLDFYRYYQKNNINYIPRDEIEPEYESDDEYEYQRYYKSNIVKYKDGMNFYENEYCYYEVLMPESKRKLFFQLEFFNDPQTAAEYLKPDNLPSAVIKDLFKILKNVIPDFKFELFSLDSSKYVIFELVITNYYFNDYKELFEFYKIIKEMVDDNYHKNYNDFVCKKIQHVMIAGCSKLYRYNIKRPINIEINNVKKILNYDQYKQNFKEINSSIFFDSLISNYDNCKKMEVKLPLDVCEENKKIDPKTCSEISSQFLHSSISDTYPRSIAKIIGINDAIRIYHRRNYFYCFTCGRPHYKTCSYTDIVGERKKMYFYCGHSMKNQYRGYIGFD